jgi:hypothetical protein
MRTWKFDNKKISTGQKEFSVAQIQIVMVLHIVKGTEPYFLLIQTQWALNCNIYMKKQMVAFIWRNINAKLL